MAIYKANKSEFSEKFQGDFLYRSRQRLIVDKGEEEQKGKKRSREEPNEKIDEKLEEKSENNKRMKEGEEMNKITQILTGDAKVLSSNSE